MVILATVLAVLWIGSGLGLHYYFKPYNFALLSKEEKFWVVVAICTPILNSFLLYVFVQDENLNTARLKKD